MDSTLMNWSNYPESMPPDVCDPYTFDLTHYSNLLKNDAHRLFVAEGDLRLKVIEVGVKDWIFTDFASFETYLENSQFNGTRVILVPQRFSWDHLMITADGFRKLFAHLNVTPAFLDVVHAFGQQTSSQSDSLGGAHSQTCGTTSEYCYLTKTVEEHGRDDSDDPWSIRQMGVYHQRDALRDVNTFIILNPTRSFQQRLKDVQFRTTQPPTWRDIHSLALSHSTVSWRRYITYLEAQLNRLKTKAHLSAVSSKDEASLIPTLKIEFGDTQDIQVIHDKLYQVKHILDSNVRICNVICDLFERSASADDELANINLGTQTNGPQHCVQELETQSARVGTILQRVRAASSLMQDIIAFRGLEALNTSSTNTIEIARLTQSDNELMLDLTKKSQRDARTLKTITVLTMIYLPASFVSFLSMGYISVTSSHHPPSLHFAGELWIFVVLTVVLLAVTVCIWLYLDHRRKGRRLRGAHENNDKAALGRTGSEVV